MKTENTHRRRLARLASCPAHNCTLTHMVMVAIDLAFSLYNDGTPDMGQRCCAFYVGSLNELFVRTEHLLSVPAVPFHVEGRIVV